MNRSPLADQIIEHFDRFPKEVKKAARFVIDNPSDVALLSMREQARRAGVQPSTMSRLAKQLGLEGYECVKDAYAEVMRHPSTDFAGRALDQRRLQAVDGDQKLASAVVSALARQIEDFGTPDQLATLSNAAALMVNARRIYCVGFRASYPVVWQLSYILSLVGNKTCLLDDAAGTGADKLRFANAEDVLFAATVMPYTQHTLDIVDYAQSLEVPIIALTDSPLSPIAKSATITISATTDSPTFYHSMTPAFALAEILAVLVAGREGDEALEALKMVDDHHANLRTYAVRRNVSALMPKKER